VLRPVPPSPTFEPLRPGDHPEFFRLAPPEGASRESTIRLDREGRFFHEGILVEHPGLARGMHTWIRRHPDDGRFILSNGYDWVYIAVEDAPFFVRRIEPEEGRIWLELSDGTREPWDLAHSRIGEGGALYAPVKASSEGGPFAAKFTRHAQLALAPLLKQRGDRVAVEFGGRSVVIGESAALGALLY
jgi:hypothetical protein